MRKRLFFRETERENFLERRNIDKKKIFSEREKKRSGERKKEKSGRDRHKERLTERV